LQYAKRFDLKLLANWR